MINEKRQSMNTNSNLQRLKYQSAENLHNRFRRIIKSNSIKESLTLGLTQNSKEFYKLSKTKTKSRSKSKKSTQYPKTRKKSPGPENARKSQNSFNISIFLYIIYALNIKLANTSLKFRKTANQPRINQETNFYQKANAFEDFKNKNGQFHHVDQMIKTSYMVKNQENNNSMNKRNNIKTRSSIGFLVYII